MAKAETDRSFCRRSPAHRRSAETFPGLRAEPSTLLSYTGALLLPSHPLRNAGIAGADIDDGFFQLNFYATPPLDTGLLREAIEHSSVIKGISNMGIDRWKFVAISLYIQIHEICLHSVDVLSEEKSGDVDK